MTDYNSAHNELLEDIAYKDFEEEKKSESHSIYSSDFLTLLNTTSISYKNFVLKEYPPQQWLVESLVPKAGITCISGAPKSGKSIITLNMALAVSGLSTKFIDTYGVENCRVLYISKDEPERLTQSRVVEMYGKQKTDKWIYNNNSKIDFINPNKTKDLINFCNKYKIEAVFIDSFRRIFSGDENSSQEINKVQKNFYMLTSAGISVVFIHHHNKVGQFKRSTGEQLRGSSDIYAMVDSLLVIEKQDNNLVKITQEALRSGEPTKPFLIDIQDPITGKLKLKFAGEQEKEKTKTERAKELILEAIETGSFKQNALVETISNDTNIGATSIKNAIKELKNSNLIKNAKDNTLILVE